MKTKQFGEKCPQHDLGCPLPLCTCTPMSMAEQLNKQPSQAEALVFMADEQRKLDEIRHEERKRTLEWVLKTCHGGGDWRRRCEQEITRLK